MSEWRGRAGVFCCASCLMGSFCAGSRVLSSAVRPHLTALSLALRSSLADSSWPIRDSAATAAGRFVRFNGKSLAPALFRAPSTRLAEGAAGGSQESTGEGGEAAEAVGDLLGLLFTCMREDPFPPVRESAAVGLVDIVLSSDVGEC